MSDPRINHDAIRYAALMRLIRGERWKKCDNCPNEVPPPRALCPVCEVSVPGFPEQGDDDGGSE